MVSARTVASAVTDPELPMLTLADLGVLRDVDVDVDGRVIVSITPTYSGCPAMDTMRDDLDASLRAAGYRDVEIRVVLSPAWSTDWITTEGRRKLVEAGIAPPGSAPRRSAGPIPLTLTAPAKVVRCPRCASTDTVQLSEFGATACRALRRCRDCGEPFDHVKEI
ncbi:MAG: phenylacetate-CoA oxygenase subunit PaaJ [Kutzneria sp.]|nr:phenylacetate-CoA oxygenase subunit PaaJ [Kutzneria sp.]